jgi:hypothetical protein
MAKAVDSVRFPRSPPTDGSRVQALPEFACPFYNYNPAIYGGAHGCSSYSSKNIETIRRVSQLRELRPPLNQAKQLQHHLQKHLDRDHIGQPKYDKVRELVKSVTVKGSGSKRDEERWIVMYMTLFDVQHRSDVPSPCMCSY